MKPRKYVRRPTEVTAVRWEGGMAATLTAFCGSMNWGLALAHGMPMHDGEGVVVWNWLSDCWLPVHVGEWIIRGTRGELYPCNDEVFQETYEPVSEDCEDWNAFWCDGCGAQCTCRCLGTDEGCSPEECPDPSRHLGGNISCPLHGPKSTHGRPAT